MPDSLPKSRSQKKRESTALQELGEDLVQLPHAALRAMQLPPALLDALIEHKGIQKREPQRRHMQYIGKLMRTIDDPEEIQTMLDNAKVGLLGPEKKLQELEKIRTAFLHTDEAIRTSATEEFMLQYPDADKEMLQDLIAEALTATQGDQKIQKPTKKLFRFLRKCTEQAEDSQE